MELELNSQKMTFSEWHEKFLEKISLQFKSSTVIGYNGNLKKWLSKDFMSMEVGKIMKSDVHKAVFEDVFHQGHKKVVTPNIQKNLLKKLKRAFETALDEGFVERNPARSLRVKVPAKVQKVLKPDEVRRLLDEAKACNHTFYKHWALALFTGIRFGEMYALRITDVDLSGNLIQINKQFTSKDGIHETKANRNRMVPIASEIRPVLEELVAKGGYSEKLWKWSSSKKEERIAVECNNLLLPRSNIWRYGEQAQVLQEFCEYLKITPVKFHDLRATFIINMLSRGVPITVVMSIVGHSRMSTTDEYNRLAGVGVEGATDALSYKIPRDEEERPLFSRSLSLVRNEESE